MGEQRNTRRTLLSVVAVVALFVSAAGVVALAQGDASEVFTGCLNQKSGVLKRVAIGLDPTKPCNTQEVQITWDRAGTAFEGRIAELEERVAELEEPFGTLERFVDCAAGETIGAVLAEAQTHPGPVSIAISGICEENVSIGRNNVFLSGLTRSDGIRSASLTDHAVSLSNARGVQFETMTISGGTAGIIAGRGSAFAVDQVTIRDTTIWAINVASGSTMDLNNCSIVDNTGFGVTASGGGVEIQNCELSANGEYGLYAESGGTIRGFGLDVNGNAGAGGTAAGGGTITLSQSAVVGNGEQGLFGLSNGTINVGDDSRIAENGADGVAMGTGSVLDMTNTVVEGNGGSGVTAQQGSSVVIFDSIVRNNVGDGVTLYDLSNGAGGNRPEGFATQIVDNGGWGINCAGPPTIASAQADFGIAGTIDLSGNGSGPTNCP